MLLRLTPHLGGDGTIYRITVMNDTGSDILTLFANDVLQLGNTQGYAGHHGVVSVRDASGVIHTIPQILVQVQLVRNDGTPWGNWINERALIRQSSAGVPRLSGVGIRCVLYIGTGPINRLLAVAATKGGLGSLLP
jgi:hypothetical protein